MILPSTVVINLQKFLRLPGSSCPEASETFQLMEVREATAESHTAIWIKDLVLEALRPCQRDVQVPNLLLFCLNLGAQLMRSLTYMCHHERWYWKFSTRLLVDEIPICPTSSILSVTLSRISSRLHTLRTP